MIHQQTIGHESPKQVSGQQIYCCQLMNHINLQF